jgi:dihydroorotate dehydrogenase
VDYCLRSGIDGIVAGNTTRSRDGLTISKEEIEKIGNGGMSGAPVHKKNLELVRYIHSKTEGKLPIIGVGGIMSEENAKAMIDAGASLVEIYSGFIYEGPALIKRIIRHLEKK